MDDEEAVAQIAAELQAADDAQRAMLEAILGPIPDWLPQDMLSQVEQALKRFSNSFYTSVPLPVQSIVRSMDTLDGNMFIPGVVKDSVLYTQDISLLAAVRSAIQQGERNGPALLLGDATINNIGKQAVSNKQRAAAQHPRPGRKNPLKDFIRMVAHMVGSYEFEEILWALEDRAPEIEMNTSWNESPWYGGEVNRGKMEVVFLEDVRGKRVEHRKSFGSIRNVLTDLRKEA